MVRFEEHKLNKEEKEKAIPVQLGEYLNPFFASLITKYAKMFAPEHPNFLANEGGGMQSDSFELMRE